MGQRIRPFVALQTMPARSRADALRAAREQVTVKGGRGRPYRITGPTDCAPDGSVAGWATASTYLEAVRIAARWRALVALDVLGRLTPQARQAVVESTETTARRLLDVGMRG